LSARALPRRAGAAREAEATVKADIVIGCGPVACDRKWLAFATGVAVSDAETPDTAKKRAERASTV
jgi:hypothetical protein